MSETTKDTIYVDVDDEITDVIDKLKASKHKIVALVLPKRASMLQSTVNMRLLKRAAKDADKNTVLITSDHNLLPLAGAVGLHVAKSLQSKPVIPPIPRVDDSTETITPEETDKPLDSSKSIGELAATPAEVEGEEVIEVDNADLAAAGVAADDVDAKPSKPKKGLKIPNFERFRLKFFLIALALLLLVGGWLWAFVIAPKAKVTIKTDTSTVTSTQDFTAKTDAQSLDLTNNILPAKAKSLKKSDAQKVPATGQKNNGNKATGTMTVTNCINDGQKHTLPAGTTFTASGLNFVSTASVTLDPALYSGSSCRSADFGLSKNVAVTAAQGGDQYNLSARSYTCSVSGIIANGSAMTGGTTQIVKVVSDADIDAAKAKSASASGVAEELIAALKQDGYVGISDTLSNDNPNITTSPKVGEEATDVTVTIEINYTMVGVKESDLNQLIDNDVKKQIDTSKQAVLEHGLDKAIFRVTDKKSPTEIKVNLQTIATVGPQIDQNQLKKEIVGKKRGDIEQLISHRPGVKEVRVDYSPFWVLSTPKAAKKITIVIEPTNAQP